MTFPDSAPPKLVERHRVASFLVERRGRPVVAVRMVYDAFSMEAAVREAIGLAGGVDRSSAAFVRGVRPVPDDAVPVDAVRVVQILRRCVGWRAGDELLFLSEVRPPEVFTVSTRRTASMVAAGRPTPIRGAGGSTAQLVPTGPGRGVATMGHLDPWKVRIVDGPIPGIDLRRAGDAVKALLDASTYRHVVPAADVDALAERLRGELLFPLLRAYGSAPSKDMNP